MRVTIRFAEYGIENRGRRHPWCLKKSRKKQRKIVVFWSRRAGGVGWQKRQTIFLASFLKVTFFQLLHKGGPHGLHARHATRS